MKLAYNHPPKGYTMQGNIKMVHTIESYENCGHCAYIALHRGPENVVRFLQELDYRDRMLSEELTHEARILATEAFNRGYNVSEYYRRVLQKKSP